MVTYRSVGVGYNYRTGKPFENYTRPGPASIPTPPSRTPSPPPRPKSTGSGSSGGGGKAAPDPYAQMRAEQAKAAAAAGKKYEDQANLLMQQAEALKIALGDSGFKSRLNQQLANLEVVWNEADKSFLQQYETGYKQFERQHGQADETRGGGLVDSLTNAGRERSEALSEAMMHGASETDLLKTMGASLRNWRYNAGEVQQEYTSAHNQILSGSAELLSSTRTQRQSAWREKEAGREQATNTYYDNMSQAYTELGNKQGEAAQYWGQANESEANANRAAQQKALADAAAESQRKASEMTGQKYVQQEAPDTLKNWQGNPEFQSTTDEQEWGQQKLKMRRAEGATLRKWAG